ncbi:adrenodoxin-like protein 2, mitochondrial [Gigantopelta aegis]|uniref:adrenodoxin-like protein 2, mitochondrial n=1 Tax=Gigantopelta aegis TaxID=1735272 RepID=UPI001B88B877|nr:adrenodoxin-like protein 2, mitochondrial [Gigantopelta aegis]
MAGLSRNLFRCILPQFANISRTTTSVTAPTFVTEFHRHRLSLCKERFSSSSSAPKLQKATVNIYFVTKDGDKHQVKAKLGDNLLDVVLENDVDIDGFGACEGTLACSTCHLIFNKADYDRLPEKPTDEELDMLDLAYDLSDTSRLGCQVIISKDMDGIEIRVPSGVADARGDS